MHKANGFTLMELLIVAVIAGTLATIGLPIYSNYINDAKKNSALNSLKIIGLAQSEYASEFQEYFCMASSLNNHNAEITTNLLGGKNLLIADFNYKTTAIPPSTNCSIDNGYKLIATDNNISVCLDHLNNEGC